MAKHMPGEVMCTIGQPKVTAYGTKSTVDILQLTHLPNHSVG